eukprot:1179497-Prorocentrum_minimum.AAC.2
MRAHGRSEVVVTDAFLPKRGAALEDGGWRPRLRGVDYRAVTEHQHLVEGILELLDDYQTDTDPEMIAAAGGTLRKLLLQEEAQRGLSRLLHSNRGECLVAFSPAERFKNETDKGRQRHVEKEQARPPAPPLINMFKSSFPFKMRRGRVHRVIHLRHVPNLRVPHP